MDIKKTIVIILASIPIFIAGIITGLIITDSIDSSETVNEDSSDTTSLSMVEVEPIGEIPYEPQATVVDGKIIYTNSGSSTCSPIIEQAVYGHYENVYELTIAKYTDRACTEDLHPVQQEIFYADGSQIPEDVKIEFK